MAVFLTNSSPVVKKKVRNPHTIIVPIFVVKKNRIARNSTHENLPAEHAYIVVLAVARAKDLLSVANLTFKVHF
jgi:hypothetical protein